jgi:hypothetical protein
LLFVVTLLLLFVVVVDCWSLRCSLLFRFTLLLLFVVLVVCWLRCCSLLFVGDYVVVYSVPRSRCLLLFICCCCAFVRSLRSLFVWFCVPRSLLDVGYVRLFVVVVQRSRCC